VAAVTLEDVVKRFGAIAAVDGVSLDVADGEFIAVLGPSGCGKSTLLRLIAGFERPEHGTIALGERQVSGPEVYVAPEDRHVGMVFQSYALWPHMSVAENIGYPLRVQKLSGRALAREVHAALDAVGLAGSADRRPADLSGGQRQRVALARCLAMKARIVLLDEPLANLDVHLRARMLAEIAAFRSLSRATLIYVTHDQAEALGVADRVAVMEAGRVLQAAGRVVSVAAQRHRQPFRRRRCRRARRRDGDVRQWPRRRCDVRPAMAASLEPGPGDRPGAGVHTTRGPAHCRTEAGLRGERRARALSRRAHRRGGDAGTRPGHDAQPFAAVERSL